MAAASFSQTTVGKRGIPPPTNSTGFCRGHFLMAHLEMPAQSLEWGGGWEMNSSILRGATCWGRPCPTPLVIGSPCGKAAQLCSTPPGCSHLFAFPRGCEAAVSSKFPTAEKQTRGGRPGPWKPSQCAVPSATLANAKQSEERGGIKWECYLYSCQIPSRNIG